MAQCKMCGRKGLLLSVSADGLCRSCAPVVVMDVQQRGRIIKDSMKLIEESKNTKTRVSRCDLLIQHAQALSEYERKGISLNPSPSQLLSQYTAIRAQLADEEKNDYFTLMEKIERARSQQRYYQALDLSLEAVKWLPQLVKDTIKEFGQWDIKGSPPLGYACHYLSVLRRRDDLRRINTLLKSVPELIEWLSEVDFALQRADLMDKVESFLLENPGFIQAKLGKTLGVDGREVSNLLIYAEQMGLIRREKEGQSYRLYSEKVSKQ